MTDKEEKAFIIIAFVVGTIIRLFLIVFVIVLSIILPWTLPLWIILGILSGGVHSVGILVDFLKEKPIESERKYNRRTKRWEDV